MGVQEGGGSSNRFGWVHDLSAVVQIALTASSVANNSVGDDGTQSLLLHGEVRERSVRAFVGVRIVSACCVWVAPLGWMFVSRGVFGIRSCARAAGDAFIIAGVQ